jgi:hypothetical protein
MPWGAKKKSTETKLELPEVSVPPIYVAHSHWHTAASRDWKVNLRSSQRQRLLRILWSRNPMGWDPRFTSCNLSDIHMDSEIGRKLTERRSNKNWLRSRHRERSSNPGSICSFSGPGSIPARGHWRCTDDHSTMRGSLNSAFECCRVIDQIIHQEVSDVDKKVKELQVRVSTSACSKFDLCHS